MDAITIFGGLSKAVDGGIGYAALLTLSSLLYRLYIEERRDRKSAEKNIRETLRDIADMKPEAIS